MYKNEARKKGVVDLNLPEGFKDLSTVHVPIGGLFDQPQVLCLTVLILICVL